MVLRAEPSSTRPTHVHTLAWDGERYRLSSLTARDSMVLESKPALRDKAKAVLAVGALQAAGSHSGTPGRRKRGQGEIVQAHSVTTLSLSRPPPFDVGASKTITALCWGMILLVMSWVNVIGSR